MSNPPAPTVSSQTPPESAFRPVRILELELSQPIPNLEPVKIEDARTPYERALLLVRLHSYPLGMVELELPGGTLPAPAVARAVWDTLAPEIRQHLVEDGLTDISALPLEGLTSKGEPLCLAKRREFLASAPSFSVIVPTRDRAGLLGRCLDSILDMDYPSERYEIIVVDNAPNTSETKTLVETYARTQPVRYLREDAPGSASARNLGLKHATGELVAFTDDDVVVDTHWLTELARGFTKADNVACVTGLVVPMELETQAQEWFEHYGGFTVGGMKRRVYDLENNRPEHAPLFPYAAGIYGTGNSMAFRRTALNDIGGFDPALGNGTPALGGVDSEVLLRTVLSGLTLSCEPDAIVYHKHRRDYDALKRQIYYYGVGLTAYMLKTVLAKPASAFDLLSKVPLGLRYALDPKSEKNSKKQESFPGELLWLELRGMAYGPLAYARSRLKYGRHRVYKAGGKTRKSQAKQTKQASAVRNKR